MVIIQNGWECAYELKIFAGLFFDDNEDVSVYSDMKYDGRVINVYTQINFGGRAFFDDFYFKYAGSEKKVFTCACTRSFCRAAGQIRGVSLPWGVMCGIRPAKNVRELAESGLDTDEIRGVLKNVYDVSDEKAELAIKVAENERQILSKIKDNTVSLYIGIPFCPTRCLYCSFVSTDIRVSGRYMDGFVQKLLLETDKTAEILKRVNMYPDNIYIGGGTPTALDERMLEAIFDRLHRHFDFSKIDEFTLEAGRPDTITPAKLLAAKRGGVNRISINPQTLNDETLRRVGRSHTAADFKEKFMLAREAGFDCINTDLIAGLPGETAGMFERSIDGVAELDPENITVHSMCVKRAANLRFTENVLTEAKTMNRMLSYAQRRMAETGREPYYMYRQKNISGNLENVGYAKPGTMSAYNVNIMEEKQTIIALGGGGSTKLVLDGSIERIFNFKDPLEYIRRFDEILKKKDEAAEVIANGRRS